MDEVEATATFRWAGSEVRKGTRLPADDPVVLANRGRFRRPGAKSYTAAWDGGPGNRERWERWGMPPRGY